MATPKSKTSNAGTGAALIETTNNGSNLERERVFIRRANGKAMRRLAKQLDKG